MTFLRPDYVMIDCTCRIGTADVKSRRGANCDSESEDPTRDCNHWKLKGKERKIFNITMTKENVFTASKYEKEVEEYLEKLHTE